MKDTLQLHEIAGYLPYWLKCQTGSESAHSLSVHTISGIIQKNGYASIKNNSDTHMGMIEDIKPILRPMSDLNDSDLMKEWLKEHSIEKNIMGLQLATKGARCIDILGYPMQFITDLYRNHFDIHNLIGRGLAVDINTLKD